jgi:hypothetical protein
MRASVPCCSSLVLAAPAFAQAPTAVPWGPAPPFLTLGARFAVMQGDPSKAALYTIRPRVADGYVIAALPSHR